MLFPTVSYKCVIAVEWRNLRRLTFIFNNFNVLRAGEPTSPGPPSYSLAPVAPSETVLYSFCSPRSPHLQLQTNSTTALKTGFSSVCSEISLFVTHSYSDGL